MTSTPTIYDTIQVLVLEEDRADVYECASLRFDTYGLWVAVDTESGGCSHFYPYCNVREVRVIQEDDE